jgi:hypothetical protein
MTPHADVMTATLIKIFRPLVRLLLRLHIPYKACAEALKWTFVDVATHEFSIGAQKQTKSRVAVITGLTRIEVEKLQREGAKTTHETAALYNRAARVLTAWEFDPKYADAAGKPKMLLQDSADVSITDLVVRYSGGATVRAVLDELLAKGNVRWHPVEQKYEFVTAQFLAVDGTQELDILAASASDLLSTIERNTRPAQTDRRLQAYVEQADLPAHLIEEVRAHIRKKSNAFLDELDLYLIKITTDALAAASAQDPSKPMAAACPRIGVGMYYFQDEPPTQAAQMDTRGRHSERDKAALATAVAPD